MRVAVPLAGADDYVQKNLEPSKDRPPENWRPYTALETIKMAHTPDGDWNAAVIYAYERGAEAMRTADRYQR